MNRRRRSRPSATADQGRGSWGTGRFPLTRRTVARYAAPAAFLLAATIAVLLVRSAFNDSGSSAPTATTVLTQPTARGPVETSPPPTTGRPARYYRIKRGDTLEVVAQRFKTTVDQLLELNPSIEPTNLRVGQRVRVR